MNKFTVKGAIMTALIFLSTALASGFPETSIQWIVFGITLVGTLAGWAAQSKLFPTTSMQGDINGNDVLKALLVSAGNVLSTFGAAAITSTDIDWGNIGKSILMLTIGFLAKQLATPQPKA